MVVPPTLLYNPHLLHLGAIQQYSYHLHQNHILTQPLSESHSDSTIVRVSSSLRTVAEEEEKGYNIERVAEPTDNFSPCDSHLG